MGEFIFVVGCPRSGTSLVSALLNGTGEVAIPVETQFIPLFRRHLFLAGNLAEPGNRIRLVESIFAFLEIWTAASTPPAARALERPFSLLALADRSAELAESGASYPELVERIFFAYAALHRAANTGDKPVSFHPIPPRILDQSTGGRAKFIHVIRDGRDVALSWMKTGFGPVSISAAAAAWRRHIRANRRFAHTHPGRCLEIRYEDLLGAPEEAVGRLCRFTGARYDPAILDFHQTGFALSHSAEEPHRMLRSGLDPGNSGKWRTGMSGRDLRLFEREAGAVLAECGYPPGAERADGIARAGLAFVSEAGKLRQSLSLRNLRLGLKALLPAALLLGARIGLKPRAYFTGRARTRVQ